MSYAVTLPFKIPAKAEKIDLETLLGIENFPDDHAFYNCSRTCSQKLEEKRARPCAIEKTQGCITCIASRFEVVLM